MLVEGGFISAGGAYGCVDVGVYGSVDGCVDPGVCGGVDGSVGADPPVPSVPAAHVASLVSLCLAFGFSPNVAQLSRGTYKVCVDRVCVCCIVYVYVCVYVCRFLSIYVYVCVCMCKCL